MTMELELDGREEMSFDAKRLDDELGTIELTITTEDGKVTIDCGRWHDDACSLHKILSEAAEQVQKRILNDWDDRPDEFDGWIVACDPKGYYVKLEGAYWDGTVLSVGNNVRETLFQTKGIAMIEMARAMSSSGIFPNIWYQNHYGTAENIEEKVREWHDNDGGTNMIEIPGVQYKPGDEIRIRCVIDKKEYWEAGEVVADYGDEGLIYCFSGDGDEHFSKDDPREDFHLEDQHELIQYRDQLLAFYKYRAGIIEKAEQS